MAIILRELFVHGQCRKTTLSAAPEDVRQTMKRRNMRKKTFVAVIAVSTCMLFSGAAFVQSGDDKKGETGTRDVREKPSDTGSLTDAQKSSVKSILSKYKASTLTADDAKAIHRSFKDAGIRGGPGLNKAVISAGFDSDKLRDLDPPPDRTSRGD